MQLESPVLSTTGTPIRPFWRAGRGVAVALVVALAGFSGLPGAGCSAPGGVLPDSVTVLPVADACIGTGCSQGLPDVGQVGAEFVPAPPEDRPVVGPEDASEEPDLEPRDRQLRDAPERDNPPPRDVPPRDVTTRDVPPPRDMTGTTVDSGTAPAGWECSDQFYGTGDGCDCGCGVDDPDCGGAGCSGAGCTDDACDFCTDVNGQQIACPGGGGPGGTWTCDPLYQDGGDGCDCGCGDVDPDCGSGGCTEPGCEDPSCDYCYDASGGPINCDSGSGGSWTCDPAYYDAFDGCDCGCGIPDPDCFFGGCTGPGCTDIECDYCYDASGTNISC